MFKKGQRTHAWALSRGLGGCLRVGRGVIAVHISSNYAVQAAEFQYLGKGILVKD